MYVDYIDIFLLYTCNCFNIVLDLFNRFTQQIDIAILDILYIHICIKYRYDIHINSGLPNFPIFPLFCVFFTKKYDLFQLSIYLWEFSLAFLEIGPGESGKVSPEMFDVTRWAPYFEIKWDISKMGFYYY